jgi:hypothetical protein
MDRDQISPSLSQAQKLHRLAQIDKIDDSAIETVIVIGNVDYYMRLSNIRITRVEGSIYLER